MLILLNGQKYPKPVGEPLSAALSKPLTAKGFALCFFADFSYFWSLKSTIKKIIIYFLFILINTTILHTSPTRPTETTSSSTGRTRSLAAFLVSEPAALFHDALP